MSGKTLFSAALLAAVVCLACLSAPAAARNEGELSDDLNNLLRTFDSQGRDRAPRLDELYDATGTLIFFDNSEAVGPQLSVEEVTGQKKKNFIQNTLDKARERLFHRENQQQRQDRFRRTFIDPRSQETVRPNLPRGPRFMALDYDGEKALVNIPPDTVIEVPFLNHIPYFFSRIEVYADGSIGVTETIQRVVEPGDDSFYGINRYFSKYHMDRAGHTHRSLPTVLEAFVDGRPVEAEIMPSSFGVRISVRDDFPLPPGVHVYNITYLFPDKIAEFKEQEDADGFKELIWSVTGQHWNMPITRAGTSIIFPRGAQVVSQSAATGSLHNPAQQYKVRKDPEGNLSFTLTYPLAEGEGLTVFANWLDTDPAPMPEKSFLDGFIEEHGTSMAAFITFLFILSYYAATWQSLKKNQVASPDKIRPLQKGDFTPAVLHYALNRKIVPKSLFILLLSMASKGFLAFGEEADGTLLLIKLTDKESGLTPVEKKIAKALFGRHDTSFAMTGANGLRLTRLLNETGRAIKKEYNAKFVTMHQSYFWFGILMAIVSVVFISTLSLFGRVTFLTAVGCVAFSIPLYFIGQAAFHLLRSGPARRNAAALGMLGLILFPFAVGLGMLLYFYGVQTTFATALMFLLTIICIGVFHSLLKSPSMLGKSVQENMEGYRLYLSSQDDTLLSVLRNADRKIKSLYDKHLPFAAAFGLDRLWTQRFASFAGDENQLKPDWYKGKLPFTESFTEELERKFEASIPQKNGDKTKRSGSFRKGSLKK